MKRFHRYILENNLPHSYGCAMINIMNHNLQSKFLDFARAKIPQNTIQEDQGGYEDTPHVTLLYGFNECPSDDLTEYTRQIRAFDISFGKVARFSPEGKDYDVIIVEVFGEKLHDLHAAYRKGFDSVQTHPIYQPHLTLAYVKRGTNPDLDGDSVFEGEKYNVSSITLSSSDNYIEHVPLLDSRSFAETVSESMTGIPTKFWFNPDTHSLDPVGFRFHHIEYAWTNYKFTPQECSIILKAVEIGKASWKWNSKMFDILFGRGFVRINYHSSANAVEIHGTNAASVKETLRLLLKQYPLMTRAEVYVGETHKAIVLSGWEEIERFMKSGRLPG